MPLHLTRIEAYASVGTAPDPATLPVGFPVIIAGALNRVNAAQDGYDPVSGGAGYGNPLQYFGEATVDRRNIRGLTTGAAQTNQYDVPQPSGGSLTSTGAYGQFRTEIWEWPVMSDAADADLPHKSSLVVEWYVPVPSTLSVVKRRLSASSVQTTWTVDVDGAQVAIATDTSSNTAAPVTVSLAPGRHTMTLTYEVTGVGTIIEDLEAYFFCEADTEPADGSLWYDDLLDCFVEYDQTNQMMVGPGTLVRANGLTSVLGRVTRMDNILTTLGGSSVFGSVDLSSDITRLLSFGHQNVVIPNSVGGGGDYAYDMIMLGDRARVDSYAIAMGTLARAYVEGTAVGHYAVAGPAGVAIGADSAAHNRAPSSLPAATTPGATAAAGTGTREGRFTYYVRGLDADQVPTTAWSSGQSVDVASGQDVNVTWVQGNYPAGTTQVEVFRAFGKSWAPLDIVRGTVVAFEALASQTLTDNFSVAEIVPRHPNGVSTGDAYVLPSSVAIGKFCIAQHNRAIIIGSGITSDADGQVQLGTTENEQVHPGGVTDRVESVSAAHTCDSSGFSHIVLANATGGAFNVTLPTAPRTGRRITVKKVDASGNAVTIATPGAETIDGAASSSLGAQYATETVVFDGTNWMKV